MSSSRSSSKNSTQTTDQRTTNTINAGLGGDVEGLVAAGNYGDTRIGLTSMVDESDNSFRADISDSSDHSVEVNDSSSSSLVDHSDNSFNANLLDLSGSSNSGNSTSNTTNSTTTNITDGGAFSLVNNLVSKVLDTNKSMIDLVGLNSKAAMQSANDLAAKGIDGAFSIKAGEQVAFGSAKTNSEIMSTVFKVAAVGGVAYVASRIFRS